jgi:hypothetical protein
LLIQAMASQMGRLRPRGVRESGLSIDGDPQQSRSNSEVLIQTPENLIRYLTSPFLHLTACTVYPKRHCEGILM